MHLHTCIYVYIHLYLCGGLPRMYTMAQMGVEEWLASFLAKEFGHVLLL